MPLPADRNSRPRCTGCPLQAAAKESAVGVLRPSLRLAVVLWLLVALAGPQAARAQSFGRGGIGPPSTPPPPRPDAEQFDEPDPLTTAVVNWWQRLSRGGKDPSRKRAMELFAQGDRLFLQGRYAEARKKYKAAALWWPDSPLEEDALLMQAECYFFEDNYRKAFDVYNELLKEHEHTRHMDRVTRRLYAIAQYWLQLNKVSPHRTLVPSFDTRRPMFDTEGHALKALELIWLKDPTGPLADAAIFLVANTHFARGRWRNADQFYTQLRQDYPNSRFLVYAYVLGLQAKLQTYQGPGYDKTPLEEAEKLAEVLLTQFRDELGDQWQRVVRTRRRIEVLKAQRDFEMAEFYARGGHYGAARYYYQQVVRKFPNTPYVQLAQKRMQQYANEPENPPQRFQWLARLFPERKTGPRPINQPSGVPGGQTPEVLANQPGRAGAKR